jgi:prophage regulatory protein
MSDKLVSAAALPTDTLALVEFKAVCAVLRAGRSFVHDSVKAGRMPAPIRLSKRCMRWRAGDIREYLRDPLNWSPSKAIGAAQARTVSKGAA